MDANFASTTTKLVVYNCLGEQVATLINETKSPGIYEVQFSVESFGDANNLSSGIYFYKLTAGNSVESREMLLLK